MSPSKRRVGALDATGHAVVIEQPIPPVKPGQVLVKVHASLISPGTELAQARQNRAAGVKDKGSLPGAAQPFGYQNAGVIEALGDGVSQHTVGDRVACIGAGHALHSDYVVVPQNLCAKLPDNVTYEQGAYTMLACTALQAIRRGGTALGEYLLVVGLGVIGQFTGQFGLLSGMRVAGWDMEAGRLKIAASLGFGQTVRIGQDDPIILSQSFTEGLGFDMTVMAFGGDGDKALESVRNVMKLTSDGHRMGRIVMVGGLSTSIRWGAATGNLDLLSSARTGLGYHDDDWEHGRVEYPPVAVRWGTRQHMRLVLQLMSEGRLHAEALTTHRLPLEKIDEAVSAHLEQPGRTLGTLLLMNG